MSFDPAYVATDAIDYPQLAPPSICLCKNGFGGFAEGVRVFRTDEDARVTQRARSRSSVALVLASGT